MEPYYRNWPGRGWVAVVVLVAITAVSPGSTSVLCISPGNHIAIEDLNSGCCGSVRVPPQAAQHETAEFGEPDGCGCCTDLVIACGPEAISPLHCRAVAAPAGEWVGNDLPPNPPDPLFLPASSIDMDVDGLELITSSIPLRC